MVVNGVGTPKPEESWNEDDEKVLYNKKAINFKKRFVHLTNHLKMLDKTLTNDELNLKVLRSLTREWQPKVTGISEKKNLSTMTSATLFGKLHGLMMICSGVIPVRQLVFKINEEQRVRPLIKSSEQNLIMHMMHAMLVHMICFFIRGTL
ncbi:hypothetical protein KIW84_021580 [Lathyrus oleraceus]|uniref:UBN2 domain-containing protein n=1 Tax=Pisum sativum TaxID=3888 RepID=A0A9D4YC28_PEA|nr:hypothetical protein KIW84_021580 [Pisum sativum]